MLPDPTLPPSLLAVLENLRRVFTAPSFATFAALATGLIANTGVGIRTLLPAGAALTVAVDDTLFKKRGKKVFGAGWQHDGAARGDRPVGYGCCFVVAEIIIELPFLTRPVCLPIAARLWRPKAGPSKVEIAAALVKQLAAWNRDRTVHVVADAAYHGSALRQLPARITVTTRLPASAVLYDLAPPPSGKRGRPRTKGDRLPALDGLAATTAFTEVTVTRYGKTAAISAAAVICLWPSVFGTRASHRRADPRPARLRL